MRRHCGLLLSAIVLGGSCPSCSDNPQTSAAGPDDSDATTAQGGSRSGTAAGGSTSVPPADASSGPGAALGPVSDAWILDSAAENPDVSRPGKGLQGGDDAGGYPGITDASGADTGSPRAGTGGPIPGTTSIFDGQTLNGWQHAPGMLWSVVNGVIDGKGTTGGQLLMTAIDYGDFRLLVSANMVAVGGSGHLGICFWGGRTPVGQYNRCKLIIPPGGYTWDYALGGGLRGVSNIGRPVVNPGWNTVELLCFLTKGFCRVGINGTAVLTYQEPNLQSIKAGPIGLQIHNGMNEEVQYRDVFVDPAPSVDSLLTVK